VNSVAARQKSGKKGKKSPMEDDIMEKGNQMPVSDEVSKKLKK
jgi:hypothetical protein